MSRVDPVLAEIFEHYVGVDLNLPKHMEFRTVLADYFKDLFAKSVREFYAAPITEPIKEELV